MIKSMTGFGNFAYNTEIASITVDIRSVNSKSFDFTLKAPNYLKSKEIEIRSLVMSLLERGKIEASIIVDCNQAEPDVDINFEKAKIWVKKMKELAQIVDFVPQGEDIFAALLKHQDIYTNRQEEAIPENLWQEIKKTIVETCHRLDKSRIEEGTPLTADFVLRINNIITLLDALEKLEGNRIITIKASLEKHLHELQQKYDPNRWEQEIIYYLERIDFTEEKIRLRKHCSFFKETMNEPLPAGKKLIFISQEIGREINTLGSKAYDADIQKKVVEMKDELEKIKEQLANIL